MHVSIVGSGYVGTTVAACLAEAGHHVTNVDIDENIVQQINHGKSPIHEPGLDNLLEQYGGDTLGATTDYGAIRETSLTILALPTPSRDDGSIDASILESAVRSLGEVLASKSDKHVVTVKSTVIPGVVEEQLVPILEKATDAAIDDDIHIATNPEFLREGTAVDDFRSPDRIVIGTDSAYAQTQLQAVYDPVIEAAESDIPVVTTGTREAMMIKYANNAFLASKISLINELGIICKSYDVDAYEVADALGLDDRIGAKFLRSGVGWGGSCFPKDTNALVAAAHTQDINPVVLEAVQERNRRQPERLLELLDNHIDPAGKRIAVLGLAFKPGTDDTRNTRAKPVIEGLTDRGATVVAYDPVAIPDMQERYSSTNFTPANSAAEALEGSHAAVVVTDWDEFAALDDEFDRMETPVVVDGRRIITQREGITYDGLTW